MIQPTALNVIIIGLSMVIFSFLWRMTAAWVENRNPQLSGAMGTVL